MAVAAYFDVWILKLSGLFPSPSECAGCGRPLEPDEPLLFDEARPGLRRLRVPTRRGAAALRRGARRPCAVSSSRPLDPTAAPRGVTEITTVARRARRQLPRARAEVAASPRRSARELKSPALRLAIRPGRLAVVRLPARAPAPAVGSLRSLSLDHPHGVGALDRLPGRSGAGRRPPGGRVPLPRGARPFRVRRRRRPRLARGAARPRADSDPRRSRRSIRTTSSCDRPTWRERFALCGAPGTSFPRRVR